MIETCKEDPVIFIETILGHKLFTYQKVYVREVFKALKKQDKPVEILGKIDCPRCGTVFDYTKKDIYSYVNPMYKYVDCPKCKAGIILEVSRFSWM